MKTNFDILIVGAGIAGLSEAITLAEKEPSLSIGVVSKTQLQESNTRLAQGGIAAVMSTKNDSYFHHIEDTIKASQQKANKEVVAYVVEHAHEGIHQLENWGVQFDHFKNQYHLGLEGGHSQARILHVKDQTGAAVHDQLINEARKHTSITIIEFSEVIEVLKSETGAACGALIYNHQKESTTLFNAKIIVLATGGMGQLFQHTTNSSIATGDGIVLAKNAGAEISNLKAIQFHPTAFKETGKNQLFLISEAVRGAGAHVINNQGERFLFKYDTRGELATRDVVSSAIYQEMQTLGAEEVYLDCRHFSTETLANEFPYIAAHCLKAGYDLTKQVVPIIPAAHYSCGGIQVNLNGESTVPYLYAVGECANTGLHGNNRLASNSLLEAIVFTQNVAKNILQNIKNITFQTPFKQRLKTSIVPHNRMRFETETQILKQLLTAYFISKKEEDRERLIETLNFHQEHLKDTLSNDLGVLHFQWRLSLIEVLLQKEEISTKDQFILN